MTTAFAWYLVGVVLLVVAVTDSLERRKAERERAFMGDHEPLGPGERPAPDWVMREVRHAEVIGRMANALGYAITRGGGWRVLEP